MRTLFGWAALVALASSPAQAVEVPPGPAPLLSTELEARVGAMGLAYGFEGGRWGDLYVTPAVQGRWQLGALGLDGGVLLTVPTSGEGAGFGGRVSVRAGFVGERFAIFAGPVVEYGAVAVPALQILPSLRAQASFGAWGLSAGLFDHHALALAHLTVELGDYGIGYVAPLGLTAHARFWLTPQMALSLQALAGTIGNTQQALLTTGLVFRPGNRGARP